MKIEFFQNYGKFLLILLTSYNYALCLSRSIDIENNSNYQMHVMANAIDLKIDHQVPARTHSKIAFKSTSIPNAENILLNAIVNNSVVQIIYAIKAGADINFEINGKKPLAWAILLTMLNQ